MGGSFAISCCGCFVGGGLGRGNDRVIRRDVS